MVRPFRLTARFFLPVSFLALAPLARGDAPVVRRGESPLAEAFRTAFGEDGEATRSLETAHKDRAAYIFRPAALQRIGARFALISLGEERTGCHACTGVIAIHYLERKEQGFGVVRAWPAFMEGSAFGQASEGWKIRHDLMDSPVFTTLSDGMWFGCSTLTVSGIELRPEGPRAVMDHIALTYDDRAQKGARDSRRIAGRIVNPVKGKGFSVSYEGSAHFVETYKFSNGAFRPAAGKSRVPGC